MSNETSEQAHHNARPAHAPVVADQSQAEGSNEGPGSADEAVGLPPVPPGGGRFTIERQGHRTIFTTAALPPEIVPLASKVQETAFGLLGLLAAIIILGPFARMIARRMERRPELEATRENAHMLQQQLHQLQQSMDAMSVEVERISESQRFQSKLLYEKKSG